MLRPNDEESICFSIADDQGTSVSQRHQLSSEHAARHLLRRYQLAEARGRRPSVSSWPSAGQDIRASRSTPTETSLWQCRRFLVFARYAATTTETCGLGLKASGTGFSAADLMRPGKVARPLLESISDLMGWVAFLANDTRSAIVDAPSTLVTDDTRLKVYAWYDNEMGYACRIVDLAGIVIAAGA